MIEPVRRGPGRPKRFSDSEQAAFVVRKARELFLESGYAGTTMDGLVERCRMSKSTLYRLFESKAEVFAAIIDDHRQSMLALPGDYDELPPEDALARIFYVDISDEANLERLALLRLVILDAREFPELHDILLEHGVDRSRQELAHWLERQMSLGHIARCNAGDAAKALMDLMFGAIIVKPPDAPKWPDRAERIRYQRSCLSMFVKGLQPR